ncbi:MAG: hypothetical protein ACLP8S_18665, partial [Solirubrobacteraceae bacterium]
MLRRLAILTVALFAPLVAVPAAAASATDLSASLINGNYGSGSGQLAVNWTNNGSTTFNGTVDVSLTVPSSVTLEGPDYLGVCSPDNTTDGCQSVTYSSSAGKLTLDWTGIITPGQAFYTKVVYQAAAQVGSLPPGQLVETISDTDPTDTDTADKTSILQAGPQQSQTISFTSTPPASPTVGGTYPVAATATSGLPVSFSIDSTSTAGACSLSGATASFTGPGTCVIDANQSGNATYAPAPRVTQTVSGIALVPVQAPQGSWLGSFGSAGYDLAAWNDGNDVVSMPGISESVVQGSRWVWASGTSDVRALENGAGNTRTAACLYSSSEVKVQLGFSAAYSGNLELYAVDWDSLGRSETITVGGVRASLSSFAQGAWAVFPITQAAGSTLTITVNHLAGPNAVLSGIFLGGGGTPPPAGPTPTQAPQGAWVGAYGVSGYDLADWNGGGIDSSVMPSGVSTTLAQGSRYVWATGTTDVRALANAAGTSRTAATYYDPNQIDLQLKFTSAYSGNL